MVSIENSCRSAVRQMRTLLAAVKLMRTRIGLLAQPESMRSKCYPAEKEWLKQTKI